jgi:plasmid stability protein
MPTLQVRDLPGYLYARLQAKAKAEHRSIAQQTIALLEAALSDQESRRDERKAVLERIRERTIEEIKDLPASEELIREDRER